MLAAAGAWIGRRHRRTGRALVFAAFALLYLLATPMLSTALLASLESGLTPPAGNDAAGAIVLLGGGRYRAAPEYGSQ
ncbi:MAG: YdcF family protein, partial [Burkholderiales bacterium]